MEKQTLLWLHTSTGNRWWLENVCRSTDHEKVCQGHCSIFPLVHQINREAEGATSAVKVTRSYAHYRLPSMLEQYLLQYMVQRLLEQKAAVTVVCSSLGGPRASLSTSEWSILEEILQILKPLEKATRELSVEKSKSSSSDTLVKCYFAWTTDKCWRWWWNPTFREPTAVLTLLKNSNICCQGWSTQLN